MKVKQTVTAASVNDSDCREDVAASSSRAAASMKQKNDVETFSANQKSLGAVFGDGFIQPQTASHCVQLLDTASCDIC